jgi:hypothetical protein
MENIHVIAMGGKIGRVNMENICVGVADERNTRVMMENTHVDILCEQNLWNEHGEYTYLCSR